MNEYDDPSTNGPGEIPDDLGIPYNFKDLAGTPTPDGENWAHDKNGNRREDGQRVYAYDDENRLIRVTRKSDNLVSEYRYDAMSRRVVKTVGVGLSPVTTRYAYDDARIIEDQDGAAATLATYVYGNYIDEVLNMQRGGADYYYHQNALWSVVAVSDAFATVVERYAYTDYGCPSVTSSAIGNPWLFTGRQWDDESGEYFYRARYYDCEAGRFLQRDAMRYVLGMNLYQAYFVPNGLGPTGMCQVLQSNTENGCTAGGWTMCAACSGKCVCRDRKHDLWDLSPGVVNVKAAPVVYDERYYLIDCGGGVRIMVRCDRLPGWKTASREHEAKHNLNCKAEGCKLDALYDGGNVYGSLYKCRVAKQNWTTQWNLWWSKERQHGNPESPRPTNCNDEWAEEGTASMCDHGIQWPSGLLPTPKEPPSTADPSC